MKRRRNWQRSMGRIFNMNRSLDLCLCHMKRNLDEVAKVLCEWDNGEKKGRGNTSAGRRKKI